jgi:hypothetical protein
MMNNPGTVCDPDGRPAQLCGDDDCDDCVLHRIVCLACWPAATAGILDTIDAATDGTCACGCARLLDPAGASMWFATAICQAVWNGRRALDVGGVLDRPDADELLDEDIEDMPVPTNRHPNPGAARIVTSPPMAGRVFILPRGVRLDDVFEAADNWVATLDQAGIDAASWGSGVGWFIGGEGPDPFAGYRHPNTDHVHVSFRQR